MRPVKEGRDVLSLKNSAVRQSAVKQRSSARGRVFQQVDQVINWRRVEIGK